MKLNEFVFGGMAREEIKGFILQILCLLNTAQAAGRFVHAQTCVEETRIVFIRKPVMNRGGVFSRKVIIATNAVRAPNTSLVTSRRRLCLRKAVLSSQKCWHGNGENT